MYIVVNMIKDLEQLAIKYQKIAECAIQLKQENSLLYNQIDNLQQQLTLLIEDKLQLEHKNNFLANQLKNIKQSLLVILDNIQWEDPSNFSCNHSKDTNGLYAANSSLSFAAAAAAAAITTEENLAVQPPKENISVLSQAVSEFESIQEKILFDILNSEQINEETDINLENKLITQENPSINAEDNKKENNEKIHYGMIRSHNN